MTFHLASDLAASARIAFLWGPPSPSPRFLLWDPSVHACLGVWWVEPAGSPRCVSTPLVCKGLSAGLDPRLATKTNSAFCPWPRRLQHAPKVPKRTLQGLPQLILWLRYTLLVSPMSKLGFLQRGLSADSSARNQAKARQPCRQEVVSCTWGDVCVLV